MLSATAPPGGDRRCWDGHLQPCAVDERAHALACPAGVPPDVGGAQLPPLLAGQRGLVEASAS
eukprot:6440165-Alexandrium_andersonii.AAC.1